MSERSPSPVSARIGAVAVAHAAVAGCAFVGNGLLLPNALDPAAFAAASLFLSAFPVLQEAFGKNATWALMRHGATTPAAPAVDGAIAAARSVQSRLVWRGLLATLLLAAMLAPWLDRDGERSRALVLALAAVSAFGAVRFSFALGLLQLGERFRAFVGWTLAPALVRLAAMLLLFAFDALDFATAIAAHLVTSLSFAFVGRAARKDGRIDAAPVVPVADRARLVAFARPVVAAATLAATSAQIDLWLLDDNGDDLATGRFRIAVLFATAIELLTHAAGTVLLPQAGRAHDAASARAFVRRALGAGLAIAALGAATLPLVTWLMPVLVPTWAAAKDLYPVVLVGVLATAATDLLGLSFVSRDRPSRFLLLNAGVLALVVLGNLGIPGDDRALVAAAVRSAARVALALAIAVLVVRDLRAGRRSGPGCAEDAP